MRNDQILLVAVPLLGREVFAKIWRIASSAGSISTSSIPTSPENRPEDRLITAELYGGDLEMRMRQEIVLGVGGVKALNALGHRGGSLSHE